MRTLFDLTVPAGDGALLATDVYLPDGDGPFPLVMERTPYGKTLHSRSEVNEDGHEISREETARAFVDRGVGVVFQDVRGRYGSQGTFTKYVNEAADGYATGEWLVGQDFSDGRIGTFGLSYAAHTQLALACLNPSWLSGMVLDSGGFSNAYQCGIRQGGAFELKQATWAVKQARIAAGQSGEYTAEEFADLKRWFSDMPWSEDHSPLAEHPEYLDYLLDQWRSGTYTETWKALGLAADEYYDRIPDVPVIHMSSWYDAYVPSTLSNYTALREKNDAPQQLIMGPWLHGDRNTPYSGDADFGQGATFESHFGTTWLNYRVDFFDKIFFGGDLRPSADVFVMGGGDGRRTPDGRLGHGGRWVTAEKWPLPGTEVQSLHLRADATLDPEPDPASGEVSFTSDPNDPVPTVGGSITSGKPLYVGGGFNQVESPDFFGTDGSMRPLAEREGVVSFTSPPLTADVTVAGELEVEVCVSTDVPDTDVTVKLVDVYPPSEDYPEGYALNVTDGILRARYRDSWTDPSEIPAGEKVRLTVTPFATAATFATGHRIRLDVAGSNFPHFDVNPNTGAPEGSRGEKAVAHTTIHTEESVLRMRVVTPS